MFVLFTIEQGRGYYKLASFISKQVALEEKTRLEQKFLTREYKILQEI